MTLRRSIEVAGREREVRLERWVPGYYWVKLDGENVGTVRQSRLDGWSVRLEIGDSLELNIGRTLSIALYNVCRDVRRVLERAGVMSAAELAVLRAVERCGDRFLARRELDMEKEAFEAIFQRLRRARMVGAGRFMAVCTPLGKAALAAATRKETS